MTSIHEVCTDTGRIDLHLIFPPQWSPFQPFLSTPSLKAYLEPKGHRVLQSDWNVGFYHYFIGRERLALAQQRLEQYVSLLSDEHAAYRGRAVYALAQLETYSELRRRVSKLKESRTCLHISEFKESVDAFYALLNAFSTAEPVIDVGTSCLSHPGVLTSFKTLHHFVDNRHDNPFVDYFEQKLKNVCAPRYFGVSIIGGEQVVAGLTLCRVLKRTFADVPIVIGGSVFSRLVEKEQWLRELFGTYFDFVCRYEGEQPMDAFLSSNNPRRDRTPNLAYIEDGEMVTTPLCEPLAMDDIPTPDYSDLAFGEYLSPHVVLPLLTTRGCYWGKCAFCYHGMIYQDRYRMRSAEMVARDVLLLHEQYGVRHFAFNDEALPPRLFKRLPQVIPPNRFFFTALYKFEKIFTPTVFREMYDVGFRSVYIGLETASERVQRHMLKNNLQSTMLSNLQAGHDAGIWNHTFVFFGFPTETESEAEETIQFLLRHADIIHSEGTGTFSFEHNAPISHNPQQFGVKNVSAKPDRVLELYYDYETVSGLDANGANRALDRFTHSKKDLGLYQHGRWIPREYLLLLLSYHGRDNLRNALAQLEETRLEDLVVSETLSGISLATYPGQQKHFVINRVSGQVFEVNEDAVVLLKMLDSQTSLSNIIAFFPALGSLARAA